MFLITRLVLLKVNALLERQTKIGGINSKWLDLTLFEHYTSIDALRLTIVQYNATVHNSTNL